MSRALRAALLACAFVVFADASASAHGILYVANSNGNAVDAYRAGIARPKLLEKLKDGTLYPQGVALARSGNAYVPGVSNYVIVFARGKTSPFANVALPAEIFSLGPLAIGPDGSLCVLCESSQNAESEIVELTLSGTVVRTIPYTTNYPADLTTDAARNLYVSVNNAILVSPPGAVAPSATLPQTSPAGGVGVSGTHLIVGLPGANSIAMESLPTGRVVRSFATAGAGDFLALDASSGYLYAVAARGSTVQFYDFKTAQPLGSLTNSSQSVAVDPHGLR